MWIYMYTVYICRCVCVCIWSLNNKKVGVLTSVESNILSWLLKNFIPQYPQVIDSRTTSLPPAPRIPKSANAPVLYIKRHRTMHIVGLSYSWITNCGLSTVFDPRLVESTDFKPINMESWLYIFTEKNSLVSGLSQFRPMLFKGQLYACQE